MATIPDRRHVLLYLYRGDHVVRIEINALSLDFFAKMANLTGLSRWDFLIEGLSFRYAGFEFSVEKTQHLGSLMLGHGG